jgi:carbonic anhydrase
MNGHTVQIDLDVADDADPNYFVSQIAADVFGAETTFVGQQFHFHAGSEHTINDVRHDLEMHTVHYPDATTGDFIAAALGIVFSVEDYTANLSWAEERIIDTFFDSLQFEDESEANAGPIIDMVTYGNLMMMVDFNNRWVYKGSVTTPPCAGFVYWNVLSTIYPVKAEHLALFEAQLDKVEGLKDAGNWREIQEATEEHAVMYVQQRKNNGLIATPLNWITKFFEWMQRWVTANK